MTLGEYLITSFRPGYEATTAAWLTAAILAGLLIVIAFVRWHKLKPRSRTPQFWLKAVGGIAIVCFVVFLAYSAYAYWYSDVAKTGLLICEGNTCRVSVHWHSTLEEMTLCGNTIGLPWETGDLSAAHTHKDNRIHVHDILDVDPTTHEIIERDPLTLGHFFDALGWKVETNCFKDTCNACDGIPATTKVWVNDELVVDDVPRDIVWRDDDVIRIAFD